MEKPKKPVQKSLPARGGRTSSNLQKSKEQMSGLMQGKVKKGYAAKATRS
jgi:hypothetical protein